MRTILFFLVLLFVIENCASNKKDLISIKQVKSPYQIAIERDKNNIISHVYLYLTYNIHKSSSKSIRLSTPSYYNKYNRLTTWKSAILYSMEPDTLLFVNSVYNKKRFIDYDDQNYVVYAVNYIDTIKSKQAVFIPYIEKMRIENKDTLHIGTIQEIRDKNPELVNGFLQGDSIRFVFYYDKGYHTITLPVEVK